MAGLQISMEVIGLDELRGRLGDTQILDTELRKSEGLALDLVQAKARDYAAGFSNVLPQSVQQNTLSGGLSGIVGSVAKTALSIEKGRPEGGWPSYEAIERWMQRKGIAVGSAVRIGSRRRVKLRGNDVTALHGDAFELLIQMKAKGRTDPRPFIMPAARDAKDGVQRLFNDGIGRALKRWAGK